MSQISALHSRQILDSRGNPTLEAEIKLADGSVGRASVPSGASTGAHEALELRDHGKEFRGQGVTQADENVDVDIANALLNKEFNQKSLDDELIKLDGTENKKRLGANATLAVSLAFAWATAHSQHRELYEYIGELFGTSEYTMPTPLFNIMNGGRHANWATDIQEYMVVPLAPNNWFDRLRIGSEIYHTLENLIKEKGFSTNVGDEGGFAPVVRSNHEALDLLVEMVKQSGYKLGDEIQFGFDAAASEFYDPSTKTYTLKRDNAIYSPSQMIDWVMGFTNNYPVFSFEDMLAEDDWESWTKLTQTIAGRAKIVGDDLLATNPQRITKAIELKACTALLVKLNQIGTLSETLDAMKKSHEAGWINIVSHRSGETEDVTIAHLAVGTACGYIKTGAPARGERTAKYNELIRIAEKVEHKT